MYLRVRTERGWKTMRDCRTHSETRKRARERGGGVGFFFKFYFLSHGGRAVRCRGAVRRTTRAAPDY